MKAFFGALVALLVFLAGCSMGEIGGRPYKPPVIASKEEAIRECRELCNSFLKEGKDLSNGPCLSTNNPDWNAAGWVCDVVNSPRKDIDGLEENQCPEFGKTISRFVEVSPQCTLVKSHG